MRKFLLLALGFLISTYVAQAQVGQGAIKATVSEADNGMPIPFANVAVKQNGSLITGGSTDFDGVVEIKPIPAGNYEIEITSLGFAPLRVSGVTVTANKTTFIPKKSTAMASSAVQLDEFVVIEYEKPLIEQDGAATQETVTSKEIARMAARSPAELAATAGGTYTKDNGSGDLNVRGGRSDANYYFIDGIKVRGSSAIPQSSIEQVSVITGGLPAQYGDVTGGVVSITTKGVSNQYAGGVEVLTSGVPLGEDAYIGLDPYGYNLIEGSVSGPLLQRRNADGEKEALLGFFLSGNFTYTKDTRPSAVGAWKVRDDVLQDIKEDPLREGFVEGSVIPNTDFLRLPDFEHVDVRPNNAQTGANLAGKIDVVTTSTTNLTFGGSMNYRNGTRYNYNQALFDYEGYPETTSLDWRTYVRFTQRFKNSDAGDDASASLIRNAFYSIQADYSRQYDRRWNPDLQDRFFEYGYIGKFDVYQGADYQTGVDSLTGIFGNIQQTYRDTLITFVPGDANPEMARFTQRYYELNGWEGFDEEGNPIYDPNRSEAFTNYNNIQAGGGLINGDNLESRGRSVYGMWIYNNDITNARGSASDNYLEQVTNQFRVSGQGSADIGNHQFILGFEYEQRVDRSYSLSPRGLWTIARLRSNTHVEQLDFGNPIIEYPGPTISYSRLNASPGEYDRFDDDEPQSFIDYNLRKATGLDPDGVDFLDVYNIDPSTYQLEYFSADELYNGGNGSVLNYYGYDPYGNRLTETPTFDEFFTARDEYGNYTRPIAPYQPIYVAGYIEDKFEFDDLIFRVGLRVDRFDANQQVLKDKYVLFPTVKAGEDEALALLAEGRQAHPGNIGDDFVVYVDNVTNPTAITGYRDGDTWYNADGAELQDASALRISNGLPAPLLVDKQQTNSVEITSESFEDYDPQVNFMPRIAFSFPISDEANFFAHYDVLTKRPTSGTNLINRLDPSEYYYLESTASLAELNNPNLQPEKTIDYEVGFQQALTNSMALKFSAFYRESRNMVQVVRVFDAYPIEYRSYDNIDFATVKGMTVSYDLRRTNNLTVRASYTLQFAEGTGASATSQLNLARSGQPNLRAPIRLSYDQRHAIVANFDYRYSEGTDYNGPVIGESQILKNTGFNLQLRGGSGEPYNPRTNNPPYALFIRNPNPIQKGAINSASLPWTFKFDFVLDRDFKMKVGGDAGKDLYLNAYVQILNLLNARNVNDVYESTGNPDDDGYLNSALGVEFTEEQNSSASFVEYYQMKLMDPQNWQLPRRIRLGVRVNF